MSSFQLWSSFRIEVNKTTRIKTKRKENDSDGKICKNEKNIDIQIMAIDVIIFLGLVRSTFKITMLERVSLISSF